MYLQTAEADEGQDLHSIEKLESFLVEEGQKVRPKLDIMKTTMANTFKTRGNRMMHLKTRDSVDLFPYLCIPDLVRIKGFVSVCSSACSEIHNFILGQLFEKLTCC